MEVIFIKELKGQGKVDQIKEVADGYAKNFLIPNGYATPATNGAKKTLAHKLQVQSEENKLGKAETTQLKNVLDQVKLTFQLPVSPDGQVQGAITAQEVVKTLNGTHKLNLTTKQLKNFKNLKTLGTTDVKVILDYGMNANLKIIIEGK